MLKFLWQAIKPYKWWYVLMMQAPLVASFYKVVNFYAVKLLVDGFTAQKSIQYGDLFYPISIYIGAILVLELAWRLSHFAWLRSQPFVRKNIITNAYNYVQNHSYEFFQTNASGSIISKIKGIQTGYNNLWHAIHHRASTPLLEIIVTIFALSLINIQLFFFMLTWCVIFFSVMIKMLFRVNKLAKKTTDSQHKAMGLVADNVNNIFSIFFFASKKRESTKLNNFLEKDTAKKDSNWIRYELKIAFVGIFFYSTMLISLLFYMIHLRQINAITVGDFVFTMTVTYFVVDNIWILVQEIGQFFGHIGDFRSSFSIIETPQEIIDKADAAKLHVNKGEIIFNKISFSHSDKNKVLKNLNLHIKAGEKVGIVGHSGSGKSTLVSLLLKNFKVDSGEIIIDEQNIADVSSDSLRSQIALIPQDTMLFHRSISKNIAYAKSRSSLAQIKNAARKAHIHNFIKKLPKGYNTIVGERGAKLSGGQRQRIAIARAILKNAPILILDEATSSLDSKTEKDIQNSLDILMQDKSKTVIAIAHRFSTLKNMDRIIVLNNGHIIQEGKHDELIKKDNLYQKLWKLQEF